MQISEAIKKYQDILSSIYDGNESRSISELVLMHNLNFNKAKLLSSSNEVLTNTQCNQLDQQLKRLQTGEPVQYVLGETEFFGLQFIVNKSVLIPRPETEELVDWILHEISSHKVEHANLNVLDIGTGSGCIPIAIKKNIPSLNVFGIDISVDALKVAKLNAKLNAVDINFNEGDIIQHRSLKINAEQFDVIVSNPPYVLKAEINLMHKNVVDFEPHLALFVEDDDALLFYRNIADFALQHLSKSGKLYFEINEGKGNEINEMLINKGFQNINLKKDIFGKERMVSCEIGKKNHDNEIFSRS